MKLENKSSRDYIAFDVILKANSTQEVTNEKAIEILLKQKGVSEFADLKKQKDLEKENEKLKEQVALAEVKEKGEFFRNELKKIMGVKNISGIGLMIGFECDGEASALAAECFEKGLLVLTAKHNKMRLLPPLNIEMQDITKGIEILKGVIEK